MKIISLDLQQTDATGGEGGSSDYNDLLNKPKINGVELAGNLTSEQLKIEKVKKTSELVNDSDFVTSGYVQSSIDSESSARENEDSAIRTELQSGLNTEKAAREKTDKELQDQIDAIIEGGGGGGEVIINAKWGQIAGNLQDQNDLKNALDAKADSQEVTTALNTKANTSDVESGFEDVETKLSSKANASDVETQLAAKANISDVETQLSAKANVSDVEEQLEAKADADDVTTKLAAKADTTSVETALSLKANTSEVNTALASKADAEDMTAKLALKADTSSLATVATSGSYNDLDDKPTIPDVSSFVSKTDYATDSTAGIVKAGDGITVTDGVISAFSPKEPITINLPAEPTFTPSTAWVEIQKYSKEHTLAPNTTYFVSAFLAYAENSNGASGEYMISVFPDGSSVDIQKRCYSAGNQLLSKCTSGIIKTGSSGKVTIRTAYNGDKVAVRWGSWEIVFVPLN